MYPAQFGEFSRRALPEPDAFSPGQSFQSGSRTGTADADGDGKAVDWLGSSPEVGAIVDDPVASGAADGVASGAAGLVGSGVGGSLLSHADATSAARSESARFRAGRQ